ncbi:MAG: C1 family peptidase [Promethearchaeia archaeon]
MGIISLIKNKINFKKKPLGCIGQDPPDPRDFQLSELQPEKVDLPEKFDLRGEMAEISDQHYGSCTAHSATSVKEYWDSKEYGKPINLSEKFTYYNTKKESGLWDTEGDFLRNAFKALQKYGVPLLEDYPDTKEDDWEDYVTTEPPEEIYEKAKQYKARTYWSIDRTLNDFREAIYKNKCPIGTGMRWYSSYYKVGQDGHLPLPKDNKVGGHAISCVGWTHNKLWFRNSWGKDWGNDGYFYIPFGEFNQHTFWNAWIMLDEERPEKPDTGWVADTYLRMIKGFDEGDKVTPTYNLNFRDAPWGAKIDLLKPGDKLEILGKSKKSGNLTWQKVKKID